MFRDFFYIRKSDRQALLFLLVVGVVALGVLLLTGQRETTEPSTDSVGDTARYTSYGYGNRQPYYQGEAPVAERFPFDPNTADSTQLLRLGLRPWQVRNIYKYRAWGNLSQEGGLCTALWVDCQGVSGTGALYPHLI